MKFFLSSVFAFALAICAIAQPTQIKNKPKLVIFINVDELHTEHLLTLRNKFTKHGFNQLVNQGAFFHSADYGTSSNYKGAKQLSMFTGAYPNVHGVISDQWYALNSDDRVEAYHFLAEKEESHPDSGRVVAAEILASTFADELNVMHKGLSKIATVGFNAEDNIFFTHAKQAKHFWFDRTSGDMLTSVNDSAAQWLQKFNAMGFAKMFVTRQWGPVADLKKYEEYMVADQSNLRHFLYDLKNDSHSTVPYQKVMGSPYENMLIRDFTAALLLNEEFGKDDHPDLLSVSFTCKPFVNKTHEIFDAEVEDMLLRLDEQIESLVQVVKDNIGLEHTLFVLSSTPSVRWQAETLKQNQISAGVFNGNKTSALLNLYLMAIHGQGKWIKGYHDKQFYLNHDLIKKENIDVKVLETEAAKFLLEVSGIQNTITGDQLRTNNYATGIYKAMQRSYYYGRSGDLFVSLRPGWTEQVTVENQGSTLSQPLNVPLVFFGWEIEAVQLFKTINMVDVAPTISSILQIPSPNGSSAEPIIEVLP